MKPTSTLVSTDRRQMLIWTLLPMAGITDEQEWHGLNSFLKNVSLRGWNTLATRVHDKTFLSLFPVRKTVGYGDILQTKE